MLLGRTTLCGASIELPPRAPGGRLALFLRPRFLGEVAALLAATNTTMCPQAFKDHFGGSSRRSGILAIAHTETSNVLQQSLNLRKLLVTFTGRSQLG